MHLFPASEQYLCTDSATQRILESVPLCGLCDQRDPNRGIEAFTQNEVRPLDSDEGPYGFMAKQAPFIHWKI